MSFSCLLPGLSGYLRESTQAIHCRNTLLMPFIRHLPQNDRFGSVAPILILYLRHLGFPDTLVGSFLSFTLLGDVLLSLVVTWTADKFGRRKVLAIGAFLMGISGIVFATSDNYFVLLTAAVVGVVSRASLFPPSDLS